MENNIIKSLQQRVLFYQDEILKIQSAIDVIKRNSDVPAKFNSGSEEKPERKTRTTKEKLPLKTKTNPIISKKPISKQVVEYLIEVDRFLLPAEIVNELSDRTGKKAASVKLLVNQTLSRLKKESKLVSFKPERSRSHVWGFQQWLNEELEPQADHLPQAAE